MAYLLINTQDTAKVKRGEVAAAKDTANFGKKERLPNYVRLEVTGATADQVRYFIESWNTVLQYSIVAENAQGWRVAVEIDNHTVNTTGIGAEVKQFMKDWILENPSTEHPDWVAALHTVTANKLTVDIAKGQAADLDQIKQEVNDKFNDTSTEMTGFQKYRFSDVDVDFGIAAGTTIEANNEDPQGDIPGNLMHHTMTKTDALNRIIDRLNP